MKSIPRKSTLADANLRRSEAIFSDLYHALLKRYYPVLPDSLNKIKDLFSKLFIIDSSTISLFSDVMKGAGSSPASGKRKGGMKAHVLVKADDDLPCFVLLSSASRNDKIIYKHMNLPRGAIVVFDKGYGSFKQFEEWNDQDITWVSRYNTPWLCTIVSNKKVGKIAQNEGIVKDEIIIIGDPKNERARKITARRITFFDADKEREFEFVTNNFKIAAIKIAAIYKRRWQIELLFKRVKTHYPLRYFLGESENAIKIQMWCALICDLLVKIVQDKLKRKWSYSNIASMIRLHLMTYIDLFKFLNDPDKALRYYDPPLSNGQLDLFPKF